MSFSQFFFLVVTLGAFGLAGKQFYKIYQNINLGKDEAIEGDAETRLKNVLLVAFGQKKMFKIGIPAVLHLFIYVAFLFTQIELLEIFYDGAFGAHRAFAAPLGGFYTFIISFIEILSVLALVATVAFISRRFILKVDRFQKAEMKGFPMIDGAIILGLEMCLITFIFMMNSADQAMLARHAGEHHYGHFAVSQFMTWIWSGCSDNVVAFFSAIGWWGHYLTVLAFMVYLPFSKHLHIFLAFPNTYFARQTPRGEMANMPVVQREVALMFSDDPYSAPAEPQEEVTKFGASDVFDLSWKNLMDAYTCTECGRCTQQCPANMTGKLLSPRKIMMDVRDRMEEVGAHIGTDNVQVMKQEVRLKDKAVTKENYEDGKNLFDYIKTEELRACTTCNACVEACPVLINPLDIILQLRRYQILDQSDAPAEWSGMFSNIENNRAPWQFSPDDRDKWTMDA